MKKLLILLFVTLVATSCGQSANNTTQTKNLQTNQNTMTNNENKVAETVVIDTNHPMAGKVLNFDIEIVKITKKWEWNTKKDVVENWDSIEVNYKGTFTDGKQFDSSYDRGQTLPFTVGAGQMIPGFDKAVVGMKVGEKKSITLQPADAYGEKDPNKKQEIQLSEADLKNLKAAWYEVKVWEKLPTMMGEVEILEVK